MSADLAVTPLFRDGDLSWHDRAACAETDPELFFVDKGGSTRAAKRICEGCEVRAECLEYALRMERNWLAFGIWGGVAPRDRERLRMDRDRRPPPMPLVVVQPPPRLTVVEPDPEPAPDGRCPECGYLLSSPGHKITCGDA